MLCGVLSQMPSAAQPQAWFSGCCHHPHSLHTRLIEPSMHACATVSLRLPAAHWVSFSSTDGHLQFWSFTSCHAP